MEQTRVAPAVKSREQKLHFGNGIAELLWWRLVEPNIVRPVWSMLLKQLKPPSPIRIGGAGEPFLE